MIKFIKNYILLLFSSSFVYIIDLVTNTYISRKIGTAVIGSYSLLMNIFSFLISLSLFGVPLTITKIVSEKTITDKKAINSYCKSAIKICIIASIISIFVANIFKATILDIILQDSINSHLFILLSLTLPFISVSACICGYFNALRKVNINASYEIIVNITKGICIFLLLYLAFDSYLTLILSLAISEIIGFIYVILSYLHKKDEYNSIKNNNSKYVLDILKISTPIAITTLIKSGLSTLKHSLIPIELQKFGFSTEFALSRYGIIHGISLPYILILSIFVECFSSLILPEYSRFYAQKNSKKISYYSKKSFAFTLNFALYVSFVIFFSADIICNTIYNNLYVAYYVKILTPLIWVMYLDIVVDNMLRGLNLQVEVIKINILDAITSILLILFLVPRLGSLGYIIVIYVSEYLNGLISLNLLIRKTNFKFSYFRWIYVPFLFLFISYIICNICFSITNFKSLILYTLLFTIIYFIFLISYNLAVKRKRIG